MKAVEVLMEHGVPEDRMIFINLVRYILSLALFITIYEGDERFHPQKV
jgi:hypothetical protein